MMSEEFEREFNKDCREKKIIGHSASKRVGKRKGCRLSSDNLTRAQWEKLNGEVSSVNLNKPITYQEWKALPKGLQETYYNHLVTEFDVGSGVISKDLFGLSDAGVRQYILKHGLNVIKATKKKGKHNSQKWQEFLAQRTGADVQVIEFDGDGNGLDNAPEAENKTATLNEFTFTFENVTNMREIMTLIMNLPLPKNARVSIEVEEG